MEIIKSISNTVWLFFHKKNQSMSNTVWLTRSIVLKSTAFIYFIAFLVSYNQNIGLIGKDSLMPFDDFLDNFKKTNPNQSNFELFKSLPTLFWYIGNISYKNISKSLYKIH